MKFWTAPSYFFNHAFDSVVTIFYERYPNSHAKHIISEDVLSREITRDYIITRKLIVKQGASFVKSLPRWMTRLTAVRVMPTIEESVFDRHHKTLRTYTRNVTWRQIIKLDEKCHYKPADDDKTQLERSLYVNVNYGYISGLAERIVMMTFRKSLKKTLAGFNEKLTGLNETLQTQ